MIGLLESAFIWGLIGGVGYAGTNLATALWGGAEIEPRAVKLAVSQCVIAVLLSPFAAYAGTPIVRHYVSTDSVAPVAFLIGLSFNAVWPLVVDRSFLRGLLASAARGLANRLAPGGTND